MATGSHQPTAMAVDPGPEVTIRQLLDRQAQLQDQQADVQVQLAALLPAKYGTNIKLELVMLRHKLHALQAYCALHRMASLSHSPLPDASPPSPSSSSRQLSSSSAIRCMQPLLLITLLTIHIFRLSPTCPPSPLPSA
jgi:hypothetical protein